MQQLGTENLIRVAHPPSRALLIFDGNCDFCRRIIDRWRSVTGEAVDYSSSQEAAARYPEIPAAAFTRAVQLIETDGSVYSGAQGVFRALAHAGSRWARLPLALYEWVPGARLVAEGCYALVSRNRRVFSWFFRH